MWGIQNRKMNTDARALLLALSTSNDEGPKKKKKKNYHETDGDKCNREEKSKEQAKMKQTN